MINSDETQCRFNPNSYTMLFIVHKDRFLYKQNSMNRARRVCLQLLKCLTPLHQTLYRVCFVLLILTSFAIFHSPISLKEKRRKLWNILLWQCHPAVTKRKDSKFHHWHSLWISKNSTDIQHRLCQDWLMGRYENLIPHRTRVITDNDQTRSPYRQYNRFRVERLQSDLLTETCV